MKLWLTETPLAILTFCLHGIRENALSLPVSQILPIRSLSTAVYLVPDGPSAAAFLTLNMSYYLLLLDSSGEHEE